MPNWCSNDLTITGPSEDLTTLANLVGLYGDSPSFDFNKIDPYPEHFREQDEAAVEAFKRGDYSVKDGFNSGGYDWCVTNWGTKWNSNKLFNFKTTRTKIKASFDTAWAPPQMVILTLSSRFPKCTFNLKYYESGMGFKGSLTLMDGEVMESKEGRYTGNRGG